MLHLALTLLVTTGCTRKEECAAGYEDHEGTCMRTATPDAGRDSSTPHDTGPPPPDAPLPDAPSTDAADSSICTMDMCGDECVDLQSNDMHCGMCDRACTAPLSCLAGSCVDEVVQVAAGPSTTCAVRSSGTLLCWGVNNAGQLGDGTVENRSTPTIVVSTPDVVEVGSNGYVGPTYSCARQRSGRVRCSGTNRGGELGDGTTPDLMPHPDPHDVVGLTDATRLWVGAYGSCALRGGGSVVCWGSQSGSSVTTPTPVPGVVDVTSMGVGIDHTCAVASDGEVTCWGANRFGQLGDGSTTDRAAPVRALLGAAEVAVGIGYSCARLRSGLVHCWGTNEYGQLGTVEPSTPPLYRARPAEVPGVRGARQIAAGSYGRTCALVADGVMCWGRDSATAGRAEAYTVPGFESAVSIAVGWSHTCALLVDGHVACVGANGAGQLGDGTMSDRADPVTVVGLP